MLYQNERTVILIDGSNIFHQTKQMGVTIDWAGFRQWLQKETHLVRAVYYTAIYENNEGFQSLRKLTDFLQYNGFDLREKPVKQYTNSDGIVVRKGNLDVEIAVDMLVFATTGGMENILLMSGDADFCYAMSKAKVNGARVGVIGFKESGGISDDLRKNADYMIDVGQMNAPWVQTRKAPVVAGE